MIIMNDNEFMEIAINEAKISEKIGEIPVGAVILDPQGNIIARGHNIRKTSNDSTAHAEIVVIRSACARLSDYRLDNCSIYVTLEPCLMCLGAILRSKISKIVYGATYTGVCNLMLCELKVSQKIIVQSGVLEDKCNMLIEPFLGNGLNKNKYCY